MKTGKSNFAVHFGILFVMLCIFGITGSAQAAAPIAQVPTGPKDINGNWATPDYYTTANWANSPPLAKFVDTLPGLTAANVNNLGQYLPVAVADTTTYPGSDYYIIELREYTKKLHSDLNPTTLRGYVQVDAIGVDVAPINYLGPVIVSERDRPVRILFRNKLPTGSGGDLFIPVDTSVMGAGKGPMTVGGQPCDNTVDGNTCASYTQNRAAIHMHGGRTPWISDGTPHQWTIPFGETTPFTQGVSLQNVPDMPNPGPGAITYYFTNQQSARLMFYHDHAFGITRLNVYAGEAAGYLITDKYEQDLVTRGILPADQIPLIIQDKTFVNAAPTTKYLYNAATGLFDTPITVPNVRASDPLWNWGSGPLDANGIRTPVSGDLWMPHVYLPAQQPTGSATGGVNPFGRWMYGPWFYPATVITHGPVTNPYFDPNCGSSNPFLLAQCTTPGQPPLIPGTPHPSMGMESFSDSIVVNGTVFPSLTVDPRAYRFRILNAANDRFQNLSFYVADPAQVSPDPRLLATGKSNLTEVKMVPAAASLAATNNWPPLWPVDGRAGGVPDPGLCQAGGVNCPNFGPKFVQIGTESGFLPNPVVIDHQPITYITDPTAFWVGNVDKMGLALGPAERADVIVDFSAYAGKTLILYNDAPAAWPAGVVTYDYYTGAPDLRDVGGFGSGGTWDAITGTWVGGTGPLAGYAPNTRTVLQVIVRPSLSGPANSYNQLNLENEFTAAAPATVVNPAPTKTLFERAQEPIIVGQPSYQNAYPNSYFPTNFPWEGINQVNDHFLQFVTLAGQEVKAITEPKGLHDEMGASFDPEYGRMSGNLAMQLPHPTTLNANLILYGFSDIPTEKVNNSINVNVEVLPGINGVPGTLLDGTQIWKISHNGVDTHPIHFHIFDVQLINRVGWDGQILMPEPNELGWKDTVKISPLEDTIVAVRPIAPALPFGIPNSIRPLNPAIPIDSTMGFTPVPTNGSAWPFFRGIDWTTGNAYPANNPLYPYPNYKGVVTNVMYDFGWEYVWHCHILSHEEMDMMRPIVLNYLADTPPAFSAQANAVNGAIEITWNDPTPINYATLNLPETYRNTANEIGFNVYRSTDGGLSFNKLNAANLLANSTKFTDATAVVGATYKVEAFNAKGSTFTPVAGSFVITVSVTNAPLTTAPAAVNLEASIIGIPGITIQSVSFYNGANLLGTTTTAPYSYNWTNVMAGTYTITAKATDSNGIVTSSAPITVTVAGTLTADFTVAGTTNPIGFCDTNITLTSTSTGTITNYSWSIGGNLATTTFPAGMIPGTYPVTLTISNAATGETAQVTKDVVIASLAPIAITGGPYTVAPNGNLTLNGSGTNPNTCNTSPLTYAWNVDNVGPYDFFTANPTISYNVLKTVLGFGTHTMTFKVTNSYGVIGTATTTLTVYGVPPTVALTAPANGTAYVAPASITLSATATPDISAAITSVDFFNGTAKIGTGTLAGGVYSFTWPVNTGGIFYLKARATDSWGSFTDSAAVAVTVSGISTAALPDGLVNAAYSQTMAFYGGTAPFTWSATGLPTGLTIDPATGIISGTPAPGNVPANLPSATFPVSITALDSSATPITANVALNLVINQAPPAAPTGLTATSPSPTQVVLSWVDNANNETGFKVERATDNTFTTGLTTFTLNTVNLTSFTDTSVVAGATYYYRVISFNNALFSITYSNTVSITTLSITTTTLPAGSVNTAYATTVSSVGGTAPYNWVATGLPTGLSINPSTGVISGTPLNVVASNATTAIFPVSINVVDSTVTPSTASILVNLTINQTAPAAPTGTAVTAGGIVSWIDPALNEIGFKVQRCNGICTGTATFTTIGTSPANATTYADTTVVSSSTYSYRVLAYNAAGDSPSNIVTITTGTLVPPSVAIAAPTNGTNVFMGTPTVIIATASATAGLTIASVNFYIDGVLVGTDTTAPYTFTWTPGTLDIHNLKTTATDSVGIVSTSATVVVTALIPVTVTLTPAIVSPQLMGTQVPFTAAGAGGTGNYEYQFNVRDLAGNWTVTRAYSTTPTWSWNTYGLAPGNYTITVYVRNVGSTASLESYKTVYFAVSNASLAASPQGPQPAGKIVQFTAGGGAGSYEYQFNVRDLAGIWTITQAYSTTATWNWNTTGLTPGNYTITVYVRNVGSTAAVQSYKTIYYAINIPKVATATLSTVQPTPQPVGTTVQFLAGATGGTGSYEYQFNMRNLAGIGTVPQAYSTTATWNWNTAGLAPGTYTITLYVRNTGSTSAVDTWKTLYYKIN